MDPWILLIIAGIAAAVVLPMRLSRVDPRRAQELALGGAVLIDVRSPAEYAATTKAKRAGKRKGEQVVAQPKKVAQKTAAYRKK